MSSESATDQQQSPKPARPVVSTLNKRINNSACCGLVTRHLPSKNSLFSYAMLMLGFSSFSPFADLIPFALKFQNRINNYQNTSIVDVNDRIDLGMNSNLKPCPASISDFKRMQQASTPCSLKLEKRAWHNLE
jgi:hypothetical protein